MLRRTRDEQWSAGACPRTRRESSRKGEGRNYSRKWKIRSKSSPEWSGRPERRLRPRLRPPRALTERERQMLQLQKGKLPTHTKLSPLRPNKEITPLCCYHSRLPNPLPIEKCQFHLVLATQHSSPGRELTRRNLLVPPIFEREAHRLFSFKPDKGRTSPDLQSGQTI